MCGFRCGPQEVIRVDNASDKVMTLMSEIMPVNVLIKDLRK